jgi:hypothetical protein
MSVALESIYQIVSTAYEVVADEADFYGGAKNEASNLLKHLMIVCPPFPHS